MPFQKGHKINLGNKWNLGRKLSEEQKKKLSNLGKTRKVDGKWLSSIRWMNHVKVEKKYKSRYVSFADKYKNGLEKKRFTNMRYKIRKINAKGSHTYMEWFELKHKFNNMCLCCKQCEPDIKLSEDHIIPLSMGGTDFIDNIQPLCVSCNTRKHMKTVDYRISIVEKGMSHFN